MPVRIPALSDVAQHYNWPTAFSSKTDAERRLLIPAEEGGTVTVDDQGRRWRSVGSSAIYAETSLRGSLFWVRPAPVEDRWAEHAFIDEWGGELRPLVGIDTCASMMQIMTIALGWRDAECVVAGSSFKDGLVVGMRAVHEAGVGFKLPDAVTNKQIRSAAGVLANVAYGATFPSMIRDLNSDSGEYGAGWGNSKNLRALIDHGAALDPRVALLKGVRDEYLPVCHALAEAAVRRDPYAGVEFRDPYDGAMIRWNALKREQVDGALPLSVSLPVGEPNAAGDYPVDAKRLRNRIAPVLIHALDASFSAHIVQALHGEGVTDIISVFDGWVIASNVWPLLYDVVRAVAEPWLRGLGTFYEVFEKYLGADPVYGPIVRGWREKWQRRVAAGDDWPVFLMKPETTFAMTT